MPDYSKGKIYTIKCKTDDTKVYVGSTVNTLSKRFAGHKYDSKSQNRKLYQEVNNDWDNWNIELYEEFPCNCKKELYKREGEVIRLIGTLNMQVEGRTQKEWRDDNAERIKENHKKHYEDNAERIKKNVKQYRINNAEIVKERKKQYYDDNAEKIKEYKKQWRIDNAERIREHDRQRYLKKKELKGSIPQ
jgi:hypothetical protein